MWFQYRAKKGDGGVETGYLEARDLEAAKKQLQGRFVAIFELKAQENRAAESRACKPLRVSSDALVGFYRRLPTMLGSGLSLAPSLNFLAESESDPQLQKAIEIISQGVSSGLKLSSAMAQPQVRPLFSQVVLGLVALGENTGALTEAMLRVADLAEAQQRLRRSILSALTYPAFLFLAILGMGAFFILVLAPGDEGLFSALGTELPWPTRMLTSFSKVLRSPGWLIAAALLLAAAVWLFRRAFQQDPNFRRQVDARLLEVPLVGSLLQKTVSAQMLYVISTGLQVGMPTTGALQLARDVCTNTALQKGYDRAIAAFREGNDLAEVLRQEEVFPMMVTSMIAMGLEVGNLEIILARISQMYEEDVDQALTAATRLAEPLLLAFAGLMSAFLALATLLPIIQVANNL